MTSAAEQGWTPELFSERMASSQFPSPRIAIHNNETPDITPPFFEQLVLELHHGHLEDNSTRCKPFT
jgi:hypothetical protein